jgi:hypothetical protein
MVALQRLAGNRAAAALVARTGGPPQPPRPKVPPHELEDRPVAVALRERGASPGESEATVLRLQALINASGYLPEKLSVDGIYGPRTQAGVRSFQDGHALPPTGVATPATARPIEERAYFAQTGNRTLRISDVWVGHEALRFIDDRTLSAKNSLLSAVRSLRRLIVLDELYDSYPESELTYWEAVAEHANGHFDEARFLYEVVLGQDEEGWRGLHENARTQLKQIAGRRRPDTSGYQDPRLVDLYH